MQSMRNLREGVPFRKYYDAGRKTGLEPSLRAVFCLPAMVPEKSYSIWQKDSEVRPIPSSRCPVEGHLETEVITGIAKSALKKIDGYFYVSQFPILSLKIADVCGKMDS